jgi:cell pole-organizing protein PopZ
MQRPEKAPEPSMEEILASIRKIIAEEPIGTRPEPTRRLPEPDDSLSGKGAGSPSDQSDEPANSLSARDAPRRDSPPYSVEDALADLIDDSPLNRIRPAAAKEDPAPTPHTRPAASPEEDAQRSSWLFGRPGASPVQPPSDPQSEHSRGTGGLLGQLDSMRLPEQSGERVAEEVSPKPSAPQRPSFANPLFGGQTEGQRTSAGNRTPLAPAQPHQEIPRPGPAVAPVSGSPPGQRAEDQGLTIPASAGSNRHDPVLPQPSTRAAEPARETRADPAAAAHVEPARPLSAPAERTHQGIVRSETQAESEPVPVAAAAKRTDASPLPAQAQGSSPAAKPKAEAGKNQSDAAAQSDAPASAPVTRTLEDTVAELLRPMLRDWLDSNMPRIVEKALRVELSASGKGSDTTGPR